MKIFFIAFATLVFLVNAAVMILSNDVPPTAIKTFKEQLDIAPFYEYQHPIYGYSISYPCFFHKEEMEPNDNNHIRFRFDDDTNIIIESYVINAPSNDISKCAETLATKQHAESKIITSSNIHQRTDTANSFIITGVAYENGTPSDGYRIHSKYIKSGKLLFVLSLIYPEKYKNALSRLFHIINEWKIIGAY